MFKISLTDLLHRYNLGYVITLNTKEDEHECRMQCISACERGKDDAGLTMEDLYEPLIMFDGFDAEPHRRFKLKDARKVALSLIEHNNIIYDGLIVDAVLYNVLLNPESIVLDWEE